MENHKEEVELGQDHLPISILQTLENLPGAVSVFYRDINGNITRPYANKLALKMFQEKPDTKAKPGQLLPYIHPDDQEMIERITKDGSFMNENMDISYRMVKSNGEIVWLRRITNVVPQADGSTYTYAMYYDITKEKIKEQAHIESLTKTYEQHLGLNLQRASMSEILSMSAFQENILQGFSKMYMAMYLINIEDSSFTKVYAEPFIDESLSVFKDAQSGLDYIRMAMLDEQSQQDAKSFFDLSSLNERMKESKVIQLDIVGKTMGWCRLYFLPVTYDEDGNIKDILFIVEHIQDQKNKEENLRNQAELDIFTSLYNRATGQAKIEQCLKEHKDGMFCLFDVDKFKRINDVYGHTVGDQVLLMIANKMKECFRNEDILVRLGGDEFVIYIQNIKDTIQAETLINRFLRMVTTTEVDGCYDKISMSFGYVLCKDGSYQTFADAYKDADERMYIDKKIKHQSIEMTQKAHLMDSIPGGIHRCAIGDNAHVVYVNEGFTEITGYTLEMFEKEFHGKYIGMFYSDEDIQTFVQGVRKLQAGAPYADMTYRIRHRDGHVVWLKERISERVNEDGVKEAVAVVMDVTKEKE